MTKPPSYPVAACRTNNEEIRMDRRRNVSRCICWDKNSYRRGLQSQSAVTSSGQLHRSLATVLQKHPVALLRLGQSHLDGNGVLKSVEVAREYLKLRRPGREQRGFRLVGEIGWISWKSGDPTSLDGWLNITSSSVFPRATRAAKSLVHSQTSPPSPSLRARENAPWPIRTCDTWARTIPFPSSPSSPPAPGISSTRPWPDRLRFVAPQ